MRNWPSLLRTYRAVGFTVLVGRHRTDLALSRLSLRSVGCVLLTDLAFSPVPGFQVVSGSLAEGFGKPVEGCLHLVLIDDGQVVEHLLVLEPGPVAGLGDEGAVVCEGWEGAGRPRPSVIFPGKTPAPIRRTIP